MVTITRDRRDNTATRNTFRARMEAQCGQIDEYRMMVLRDEGRRLSRDEAAMEWIERHAATYANDVP